MIAVVAEGGAVRYVAKARVRPPIRNRAVYEVRLPHRVIYAAALGAPMPGFVKTPAGGWTRDGFIFVVAAPKLPIGLALSWPGYRQDGTLHDERWTLEAAVGAAVVSDLAYYARVPNRRAARAGPRYVGPLVLASDGATVWMAPAVPQGPYAVAHLWPGMCIAAVGPDNPNVWVGGRASAQLYVVDLNQPRGEEAGCRAYTALPLEDALRAVEQQLADAETRVLQRRASAPRTSLAAQLRRWAPLIAILAVMAAVAAVLPTAMHLFAR